MARKFREARALLADLLDRHEAGVENVRAYPDHEGFRDVLEADRFAREIRTVVALGAVAEIKGSGRHRDQTVRIDLRDPAALYVHLGRVAAPKLAAEASTAVFAGLDLDPGIVSVGKEAIEAWSRNKKWCGIDPGDATALRKVVVLAQAILDGKHSGTDYRTFSRRHGGGSKDLERLEMAVLRVLAGASPVPRGHNARSVLAEIGLERFGPPLLLSGPVTLDDLVIPTSLAYFGIPPKDIGRIGFTRAPQYILSIENQTSFNRQVGEIDRERQGLTLYVGGYPSLDIQRAISVIANAWLAVPFFHWSDIDPEGTWIFRTVERAAGRPVIPHLMTPALAEQLGEPLPRPSELRAGEAGVSAIADLVNYFAKPGAKWLEQEELDPVLPALVGGNELGPRRSANH